MNTITPPRDLSEDYVPPSQRRRPYIERMPDAADPGGELPKMTQMERNGLTAIANALVEKHPLTLTAESIEPLRLHHAIDMAQGVLACGGDAFKDVKPFELASAINAWARKTIEEAKDNRTTAAS